MMIFIEGVDGSGKTTLLNTLGEQGYEVHYTYNWKQEGWDFYKDYDKEHNEIHIFDRSPLTDICYRLEDDKTLSYKLQDIIKILSNSKIIYCNSPTSFVDSIKRGETNITEEFKHEYIKCNYKYILKLLKRYGLIEQLNYNWHIDSIDKVINFIGG